MLLGIADVAIALGSLALLLCPWFAITSFPWAAAIGMIALGAALRLRLKSMANARLGSRLFIAAIGLFILCLLAIGSVCARHWTRHQGRLESSCGRGAWKIVNVVPEADIASLGVRLCGVMGFLPSNQASEVHALLKVEYRRMERDEGAADAGNVALMSVMDKRARHAFILYPRNDGGKPLGALLFLHGAGAPMALYPWLLSDLADRENLIVLCPSWDSGEWSQAGAAEYAVERLRAVMAAQPVDAKRIYLGGISMGGAGGWSVLDVEPRLFRGFICISGYGAAHRPAGTPVLMVEGGRDAVASTDQELRRANPRSRLIVLPDDDHFAFLRSTAKVTETICEWMDSMEAETP